MAPARSVLRAAAAALCGGLVTAEDSWVGAIRTALRGFVDVPEVVTDLPKPKPLLPTEAWKPLRDLLDGWQFTQNFAVVVGDERGVLFQYEKGNFTVHTVVETASTSKWPSAMMLAGLVNDGTISSLDDPVNKYLKWWTTDPKDNRSKVTFRHLLSFTSCFGDGSPGDLASAAGRMKARARGVQVSQPPAPPKSCGPNGDTMACARTIYNEVNFTGVPGKCYSYNSNHLQLGAAVAVAASGLDIQQVIRKYLFEPYGMNESTYPGTSPDLATALRTTGHDYKQFLRGVFTYKPLSKAIVDESEKDATPFLSDFYTLYGDYGFGHFLSCFDSIYGMTQECRKQKLHIDPGAFGFYPLIDRRLNYYMELVAFETGKFYPLSGIPEYLAVAMKPVIDDIMQGKDVSFSSTHHSPEYNSLSLFDVNYMVGCWVHPESCM